jgi:predicted HicB family RNase H-like nuclease
LNRKPQRRRATAKNGNSKLEQRAREILRRPYSRVLIPQDEGGFTAEILEFPGCFAEGDSADEANAHLEAAADSWLLACFESGKSIPDPLAEYEGSGKFALRLPRSLYGRAAKAAARDGVSLNQFITDAVAEKVGATMAAQHAYSWWGTRQYAKPDNLSVDAAEVAKKARGRR